MKFLNFGGEPANVKLSARFDYKGFIISASTIFTSYASIAILSGDGEILATDIASIEDAIIMINHGEV